MRTAEDICLLCMKELATATNSHIFPKYISTKFFGEGKRKGYTISSENHENPIQEVQDSPKEDHILCQECEDYFCVLERISSHTFNNWRDKVDASEFERIDLSEDLYIINCHTSEKKVMWLFIYSLFWRAGISSNSLFNNYKLSNEIQEEIRVILVTYRSNRQKVVLNILNELPEFNVFPVVVHTADSFDVTKNILFSENSKVCYRLTVDQFCFMLFENYNQSSEDFLKTKVYYEAVGNFSVNDFKIAVLSKRLWVQLIIDPVVDLAAERTVLNKHNNENKSCSTAS
jgi:hypothetical protein